jgi:ubiquinone/menaquinone biosynthesis C-methylase UbiE
MKRHKPKGRDSKARVATAWTAAADWYDELVGEEGSEFHREVIFPGVLRLLQVKPNEAILDVACGQGAFCRMLAQQGARATGIDASPELIKLARERNSASGGGQAVFPEYRVADARNLSSLPGSGFAGAVCILAIQNIDKLPPVFQGIQRVLSPGGRVVLVMMHPCFRNPKYTSWGWDEQTGAQYRRVDRYLLPRKEPIVTHPGQKGGQYTWTFHRPMQMYVKAMRGAGLLVDRLEEWPSHKVSTSGPRAAAENQARSEIPMFLAMRGVKTPMAVSTAARKD